MWNRLQRSLAVVALAGLFALAACQKKAAPEGDTGAGATPADTAMTPPAPDMPTTSSVGEPAQISVTNAMPHPMVVKGDWGQGEQELGTVDVNETKSFDVDAPAGSQVTLTATDKDASHSTSGSLTSGPGAVP